MRIVFVTNAMVMGGVEKNIVRLTGELTRRGHEVIVASRDGVLVPELEPAGGRLLPLRMALRRPRSVMTDISALRRVLRNQRVDVVHVFSASAALLTASARLGLPRSRRVPVIASVMGLHNSPDEAAWRVRLRVALLALGARRLVVMAPAIEAFVRTLPIRNSRIVHQSVVGVELPGRVDRHGDRHLLRQELGVGDDTPVVVTIGRLDPRKSHELFIRAAARLRSGHPDVVCCIVGDGVEEARLHTEIDRLGLTDAVRMLGNRLDVDALLRASDVCVRPGVVEGFIGITVLEAQALGVPVVSFETEDVKLAIEDGVTGLLVPRGDTEGLAAAVARLLDDRALATRVADAGREHVARTYALPAVVTGLEKLYGEVASEQGRS